MLARLSSKTGSFFRPSGSGLQSHFHFDRALDILSTSVDRGIEPFCNSTESIRQCLYTRTPTPAAAVATCKAKSAFATSMSCSVSMTLCTSTDRKRTTSHSTPTTLVSHRSGVPDSRHQSRRPIGVLPSKRLIRMIGTGEGQPQLLEGGVMEVMLVGCKSRGLLAGSMIAGTG